MSKLELFKYCFGCNADIFSETVILTPFIPVKRFESYCDIKGSFSGRLYSGVTCEKDSGGFTLVRCGMGSSLAGDCVLLLDQTRAGNILFAGSCGGLGSCNIGDIVICEKAFDGGGFPEYVNENFTLDTAISKGKLISSDISYSEELMKFVYQRAKDKTTIKNGDVFTIGSLILELEDNVFSLERSGFKGIDMELAAVYSAAKAINLSAAAMLFISDIPRTNPLWEVNSGQKDALGEIIRFSVEFAAGKR